MKTYSKEDKATIYQKIAANPGLFDQMFEVKDKNIFKAVSNTILKRKTKDEDAAPKNELLLSGLVEAQEIPNDAYDAIEDAYDILNAYEIDVGGPPGTALAEA